ncbi:BTB/POZ domain-containing adapter for CUL3-mediated RhoA degradation protein 2-like [Sinocyclocheilus grahami]|uniref:BTB/POZ domain-containing adapter for CUL3-mediated RhoA degradation protein 2 n=1 Tax=Sinocyclocheilus grahami TaxID=75366 RepID=A0A672JV42_SINGR|nr:PREDICTED: BTB/POZ domain-containing adapter for CUL3-mediated RhoA degradation protein 2-like [Sinocyclocheilus grahami]XP_016144158.1 PREDICTED: BTB/POZ domain-containing adapter for CUL3-mediated RhoA degradation protein 2-like [Sinocyclocheilus grahami]XP_016144159.1 PREDICTED: BTB/POZ domain-containing adapter for CUL3-mediated RhoA degradation protein 2-like [Sinocyclocheilus grahami]
MSGESCLHQLQPQTGPVVSVSSVACPKTNTCTYRGVTSNKYVQLNVGGNLYYSTLQVLTRQDTLLRSMFSGKMEVLTDKKGWILIDRCGKHFGSILSYLRDGFVTLPKSRQGIMELLAEAKYYQIQGLIDLCQRALQDNEEKALCVIPVITSLKEEERLIQGCVRPAVKLLYNRGNNKYSYTSNSDDNLLKNIELFEKLSLSYSSRVLFIKDVIGDEICCWSFYGQRRKLAEVCCTSIVYATEKKQTKVEFPEARIYEETLNALLYETLPVPDNSLLEATRRRNNCCSHSEEEEAVELRERVRRIHIKRYSTYDDRPLGH